MQFKSFGGSRRAGGDTTIAVSASWPNDRRRIPAGVDDMYRLRGDPESTAIATGAVAALKDLQALVARADGGTASCRSGRGYKGPLKPFD